MTNFGTKDKKYILHPGSAIDLVTGDSKRIGPIALAKLYGVSLDECIVLNTSGHSPNFRTRADLSGFTHLYPRADGDYRIT